MIDEDLELRSLIELQVVDDPRSIVHTDIGKWRTEYQAYQHIISVDQLQSQAINKPCKSQSKNIEKSIHNPIIMCCPIIRSERCVFAFVILALAWKILYGAHYFYSSGATFPSNAA